MLHYNFIHLDIDSIIYRILCYTDHIAQGNQWSLIDRRPKSDRQLGLYYRISPLRVERDIMTAVILSVK